MKTRKSLPKKSYSRPKLRKIALKADEILAIGCKSASGGSSAAAPPPCTVGTCAGIGS